MSRNPIISRASFFSVMSVCHARFALKLSSFWMIVRLYNYNSIIPIWIKSRFSCLLPVWILRQYRLIKISQQKDAVQWIIPGRHLSRSCQLPASDVSVFNLADIVYQVSCCLSLGRHARTKTWSISVYVCVEATATILRGKFGANCLIYRCFGLSCFPRSVHVWYRAQIISLYGYKDTFQKLFISPKKDFYTDATTNLAQI